MPNVAPSSNFRDPFGLLVRMLRSGNRAAYSALLHEAMRIAAIPLDVLLSGMEKRCIDRATSSRHPLLLIVGPPRSGTTLVYQALAQYLDVSVPTNLSAMFPRSPLTVSRLFHRKRRATKPEFRNFYGQTASLHGSNDAFHLWNRWLGDDRYNPAAELSSSTVADMQKTLAAWTIAFDRPLLNKNNRNAACIDLLARHLPSGYFIVVQRQPLFVVQSLIKARRQVQGDSGTGWGLRSHTTTDASDPLAYVDDVCEQVITIDAEIEQQLRQVASNRVVRISYEEFCEHPAEMIAHVANSIPGVKLNDQMPLDNLPVLQTSSRLTLTPDEHARAVEQLKLAAAASVSVKPAEFCAK
ncbi:MAG: sulfotransferase [Planctomycetaceae bacterium]